MPKKRPFYFLCLTMCLGLVGCVTLGESKPLEQPIGLKDISPPASPIQISAPQTTSANPSIEEVDKAGKTPAFAELKFLTSDDLVKEAIKRNPTVAAMTAASEAARAKYPQVISLEDPDFTLWAAPGSFGSHQVGAAFRFEYSQKIPGRGKRQLRGEMANAEANAADQDLHLAKQILTEDARNAFYDLFLIERLQEVNLETLRFLNEFRQNAETRYKNGQAPQQDVLQVDVEIGLAREKSLTLNRMKKVARARINTLLHLEPDLPLPPLAKELQLVKESRTSGSLRQDAGNQRPELKGLQEKIRLEESALNLARREFAPDYEAMAAYDGFWQNEEKQMQYQLGLKMNLPSRRDRRYAAVTEAQARLAQRKAEQRQLEDKINLEVQEAYEQVLESEQVLELFKTVNLPAAKANVKEAQTAYSNGKIPFLSLVAAQKDNSMAQERFFQTQAEAVRRKASLARATAEPLLIQ